MSIPLTALIAWSVFAAACQPSEPVTPDYGTAEIPERDVRRKGLFMIAGGIKEVSYRVIDGQKIAFGDIVLTQPDLSELPPGELVRAAVTTVPTLYQNNAWPNGVVNYQFGVAFELLANAADKQEILDAIEIWEDASSMTFVESNVGDHIKFVVGTNGNPCTSAVGRQADGAAQQITLPLNCNLSNVVHEIGHALGLHHEHQRIDRDDYIQVLLANIIDTEEDAFEILEVPSQNVGKYGFNSIMHYESYNTFGLNPNPLAGMPTLTRLNGRIINPSDVPTGKDVCAVERFNRTGRRFDIDNDGYSDLPIGAPYEDVSLGGQGLLTLVRGSASGLSTALGSVQVLHRGLSFVAGSPETNEYFASAVAIGDFDGDCQRDVVVGSPGTDVGGLTDAGSIHVFYGNSLGFNTGNDELFHLDGSKNGFAVAGQAEAWARLGASVASGDFNGDGYDDVAVGAPDSDIAGAGEAGSVLVLYGGRNGLKAKGSELWSQNSFGILDTPEADDEFGYALASGDLNADGIADLVIGVPGEDDGAVSAAGAVSVIYGSLEGLDYADDELINQSTSGIPGASQNGDRFGATLAIGAFRGAGDEIAIGIPYDDIGGEVHAGRVVVVPGGPSLMGLAPAEGFTQNSLPGVSSQAGDQFGYALAAGDFDGDGVQDLAVGAPCENTNGLCGGAVNVIYGQMASGLETSSAQFFTQDTSGVGNVVEAFDYFGRTLTSGDYDGDGSDDLVVGVPLEDVGGLTDAGAFHVFYGASTGLSGANSSYETQSDIGLETSEAGDQFGGAL